MSLHEDGVTFRGYIRVTVNLSRPVTVLDKKLEKNHQNSPDMSKLHSHSNHSDNQTEKQNHKQLNNHNQVNPNHYHIKIKKFDTFSKNLHLTSQTTSEDVISALLNRYKITTHIKKFALFEKTLKSSDHEVLCRLSYNSRPLLLRLIHGKNSLEKEHTFILRFGI